MKLAHIPEDRMTTGCAKTLSIQENLFSNQYKDSGIPEKDAQDKGHGKAKRRTDQESTW